MTERATRTETGSARFSALRGRRVRDDRDATVGFVLDVIVQPAGDDMLVTQFVLVRRRFELLLHRLGLRVGAFVVDAARVQGADEGILRTEVAS